MVSMRTFIAAAAAAIGAFAFSPAMADPLGSTATYTFDCFQGASASTCNNPGTYGTVELTQESSTEIQVSVNLAAGVGFVNTGSGNHPSLGFNITGDPTLSVLSVTNISPSGFAAPTTNNLGMVSGYGNFDYGLTCTVCGSGASNPQHVNLIFDVSVNTGTLNLASFIANSQGISFVADVGLSCTFTGDKGCANTGVIGTNGSPVVVECTGSTCATLIPEPVTISLFGAGLAGLGAITRRRRAKKSA